MTASEMKEIIDDIKASEAIDKAFSFSERYLHKALDIIKTTPSGQAQIYTCEIRKIYWKTKILMILSKK